MVLTLSSLAAVAGLFMLTWILGDVAWKLFRHQLGLFQQAAGVSDYTAYMYMGKLVEFGVTSKIFLNPDNKKTEDYVTGRFG